MTNNQIKYMIEVARTGSINQAARNLFISQSALSNAISNVEQEFGKKIFFRTQRGVTLTSFGKIFIAYITPINRQLEQLYTMRGSSVGLEAPSITIASNGFFYLSLIAASLGEQHKSSGVRINLMEDYSGDVVDAISSSEADLAVVRLWSCYKDSNLDRYSILKLLYHPICQMDVGIDVGIKSPLYNYKGSSITSNELSDFPQIIHECLDCGPYSDIHSRLRMPVGNVRYIVNSRAAIYELLNNTQGYCLNSRKKTDTYGNYNGRENLPWRFIPFKECPISSEIGWVVKDSTTLTPIVKEFIHMLKDYLLKDISEIY